MEAEAPREDALAIVEATPPEGVELVATMDVARGVAATSVFTDQSGVLHPGMGHYFNARMFSDVNVLAPDGRRLACHQVVLSAGSKRFAKILEQGILQADKELPVWGVDSDALEAVIRCFYTGECTLTASNVVPVMDAAQRLEVIGLTNFCDAFVQEVLVPEMVVTLLEQAVHFRMEDLTQQVLQYSERCLLEVANHDDYLRADVSLVTKLLSHHKTVNEPAVVLKAGWEWLVADTAHNASVQDIAGLVQLPEGMQADDLLDRAKAAEHNITWRQPEPAPVSQAVSAKEEPAPAAPTTEASSLPDLATLLSSSLPQQLAMLQQAGLLSGSLPLNLIMSLQTAAAANAAAGVAAGGEAGTSSNTPMTLAQLLSKLPGAAPAIQGGLNQALAAELLAQLTGGAAAKDLLARLTELQQQAGQAGKAPGKRSASAAKLDEDDAGGGAGSGAAKRSSTSNRTGGARGMCQVEGCNTDLSSLRDYHQRYKICEYHLKIPNVMKDGAMQRFCQQCGRFQLLSEFEGNKRSCKARLQRHNDRRRKRLEEEPSSGPYTKGTRGAKGEEELTPPPPAVPAQRSGSAGANTAAALTAAVAAGRGNWGSGLTNLQMLTELMNRVTGQASGAVTPVPGVPAATTNGSGATASGATGGAAGTPPTDAGGGTPPPPATAEAAGAEDAPVSLEGVAPEPAEAA